MCMPILKICLHGNYLLLLSIHSPRWFIVALTRCRPRILVTSAYLRRAMAIQSNGSGVQQPSPVASEVESTVIIGAGIIGCATAYYLATSGKTAPSSIHIIEASPELFASASGKAGGFCTSDCGSSTTLKCRQCHLTDTCCTRRVWSANGIAWSIILHFASGAGRSAQRARSLGIQAEYS